MDSAKQDYFPVIDLLRGLAAIMVCFYHFTHNTGYYGAYLSEGNWLKEAGSFGWLGVEMFFVISGFVIPYSLFKNQYTIKKAIPFIKKRWLRIEPPYIVTIFLILLNWKYNGWLWSYEVDINWKQVISHFFYLPQFLGYTWINEIFWTLAIEFQYYLFMALFFVGFMSRNLVIKSVAVIVFVLPFFLLPDNRLLTSYSSLFLLGMVVFWFKTGKVSIIQYFTMTLVLVVFAWYQFPLNNITIPLIGLLTSLAITFIPYKGIVGKQVGRISYSLYLTHGLIGGNFLFFSMYLSIVKSNEWLRMLLVVVAILLSVIFAMLFYKMVEGPSQRLSKKVII
jgi:peptidoglycan/LPS O-acetylase OafA/YrhL